MLRDESLVGWVEANWALKKNGIGIYHTIIWAKRPKFTKHEKWVPVEITMKELCRKKDCLNRDKSEYERGL